MPVSRAEVSSDLADKSRPVSGTQSCQPQLSACLCSRYLPFILSCEEKSQYSEQLDFSSWESDVDENLLQTPGPAPDFATHAVVNGQIGHVGLKDYQGEKYVVLVFYPMDFVYAESITPFCKRVDDFKKLNCAVLAMSTDSVYSHKAFVKASK